MSNDSSWSQQRQLVYQELCKSYLQIDDFRSKLLAALPIASAGSVFVLVGNKLDDATKLDASKPFLLPIGAFGAIVTLALFCYEIYGIRKCGRLIATGIQLETDLKVVGQFTRRPNDYINEPFAAGIIYPAVLAGWVGTALYATGTRLFVLIGGAVFLGGFLAMLIWNIAIVRQARAAEKARDSLQATDTAA